MSQNSAGPEILRLIELISRLPGLGPRSARRVALFLLKRRDTLLKPLADALAEAGEMIERCKTGRWSEAAPSGDGITFWGVYCPRLMASRRKI